MITASSVVAAELMSSTRPTAGSKPARVNSRLRPTAVIFDVGHVLYDWNPRYLYRRLIDDDCALDLFLRDVVTPDWHFQHDAGRRFADTSAELIAQFPDHEELIAAWGPYFLETLGDPMSGMPEIVAELEAADVPIFAITNFSGEFWQPFRAREAWMFDRFCDIVVSGDEKLVKPDPAIYRLALDRFGLAPAQAVFFDDREDNVAAASALGIIGRHFINADHCRADLVDLGIIAARYDQLE